MLRVIIDDEPKAIETLVWELENFCPSVSVEATFTSSVAAKKYMQTNEPDCVFLDIEMPDMDGFLFLKGFPDRSFCVVFVTAYNQYAITAIKENAADYLLKPIDADELITCVERVKTRMKQKEHLPVRPQKIPFNSEKKIVFLNVADILYCRSDGAYTEVFTKNGEKILVTQLLKNIEEKLSPYSFIRIHHRFIVNFDRITAFHKKDEQVLLTDGTSLPVSRKYKPELLKKL